MKAARDAKQSAEQDGDMDDSGYFALAGVVLGFVLTELKGAYDERNRLAATKKQIASALLAKITALRDRTWKSTELWTGPGHPLMLGGFEGANLFAVYDGNADKLGLFTSEDAKVVGDLVKKCVNEFWRRSGLSRRVVGTYLRATATLLSIGNASP